MMSKNADQSGGARRTRTDWRLVRYLLPNLALGAICGWIFVGALVYFDFGGLGGLVATSSSGPLALIMLLAVMTITWGSLAMGTAIFLMPKEEEEDRGLKTPAMTMKPQPVRIAAKSR